MRPAAHAGEDAPYPIWWSPELKLESLDLIDRLLDKNFPEHLQFVITLHWSKSRYKIIPGYLEKGDLQYTKRSDPTGLPAQYIANCRDLFEWSDHRNNSLPYSHLDPIYAYYATYCYSLDALNSAKPARISYVRNFRFDAIAPDFFPAMIGHSLFCDWMDTFLQANRDGVPWGKFPYLANGLKNRTFRLSIESDDKIHVYTEYPSDTETTEISSRASITLMGRGDFDDDGYEDLLIRGRYEKSPFYGIEILSSVYLLSRRQDNAVLRAIDLIGPPASGKGPCDERELIRNSGRYE